MGTVVGSWGGAIVTTLFTGINALHRLDQVQYHSILYGVDIVRIG